MSTSNKTIYRSRTNRQLAGVCAGLGDLFGIDPTIIRLLFVFGVIFGYGSLLIVYLVMFLVVPEEPFANVLAVMQPETIPTTPAP